MSQSDHKAGGATNSRRRTAPQTFHIRTLARGPLFTEGFPTLAALGVIMKTIGSNGMPRSTKQNNERWSEDFSYYGPETLLSRKRLASTAIKSDTADASTVVRSAPQL